MKVSVYLPAFNMEKYIRNCLEGVLNQYRKPDEIILVNDGSTDRTMNEVYDLRDKIKIINHDTNKGLAAARNTGVGAARNEIVATLDTDAVPERDWLDNLIVPFTLSGDIGATRGAMYEKYSRNLADAWRTINMFQHSGPQSKIIPWIAGCNHAVRKSAWEKAGGFDEKFKTNYEDMTFSKALKDAGYYIFYTPDAVVWHHKQDTLMSVTKIFYNWMVGPIANAPDATREEALFRVGGKRLVNTVEVIERMKADGQMISRNIQMTPLISIIMFLYQHLKYANLEYIDKIDEDLESLYKYFEASIGEGGTSDESN